MSYFLIIQLLNEKNYAIKEIEQKNLSILFLHFVSLSTVIRRWICSKNWSLMKKSPHFSSMTNLSDIYQIQLTYIYVDKLSDIVF